MKKCIVYYSRQDSVSRLITGFNLLKRQGIIDVDFKENIENYRRIPSANIIEMELDNKLIAFDMGDRWALCDDAGIDYLQRVDGYFARDYSNKVDIVTPLIFTDNDKVKPFGFNYYVTFKGNPLEQVNNIRARFVKTVKDITRYSTCMYPEYFEQKADWKEKDLKIIFMARLWDTMQIDLDTDLPRDVYDYRVYMFEERTRINKSRTEIMRKLKKEYGPGFIGGIYRDSFSEKYCPDLIVPKELTRKKAYLDQMKKADICIGTMGLHRSIGWKIGEYIAAARAIVAERFEYIVPGNFDDGKHYIPYDTADECCEAVSNLYENPALVYEMKRANEEYYLNYLKVERQLLNAFKEMGVVLK